MRLYATVLTIMELIIKILSECVIVRFEVVMGCREMRRTSFLTVDGGLVKVPKWSSLTLRVVYTVYGRYVYEDRRIEHCKFLHSVSVHDISFHQGHGYC